MSKIAVYADWEGLRGPQYPPAPRDKFGVFDDSSPDRWGRNLMDRRFDRTDTGQRLHFASAMTMTGHSDGDDASTGVSYLELAEVIMGHGAQPNADLRELWSRIVFNILVSNTDGHLRNHGFILVPGKGWKLSQAYDMNPVAHADGLKLNITDADNALDLELAREVAAYFRLNLQEADATIEEFRSIVGQWRVVAQQVGLSASEQDRMAGAFRLADSDAASP